MGFKKVIDRSEHDVLRALVARWRTEAGLSQRELSARLNRPHNYMVKVEGGTKGLEVVELIDIIRTLGKDVSASLTEYARLLTP